ncbi:MAG: ribosome silencing factor [Lachnospiraceae bacterium]|nr:ribosome silencing factor [Lachnospiraceae bacterium]
MEQTIKAVYNALDDKKGIDIKVLDISEISVMADYFIIASGSNKSQVQALADNVEEEMLKLDIHCKQVEGYPSGNWILMDYGDFIVHVFNQDDRLFYDLERIWKDGKLVEIEM